MDKIGYLNSLPSGMFVEVGASHGGSTSTTSVLLNREGWKGIWIEADEKKFVAQSNAPGLARVHTRINPQSFVKILDQFFVPKDFEYFVLDIDSFDYYVLLHTFSSGYRPKLVEVEINEKIPYSIRFAVKSSEIPWDSSHFYGMSLRMLEELCFAFEYEIVGYEAPNALIAPKGQFPRESIIQAMRKYCEEAEFNQNVKHWHSLQPAMAFVEIINYFMPYAGRFIIEEAL